MSYGRVRSCGMRRGCRQGRPPARAPRRGRTARAGLGRAGRARADRGDARGVVGVAVVDDHRDVGLHLGAAERLGVDRLADRRPHQRRAGEEDRAGLLDDQRLVGHDRQVRPAGHARTHDRGELVDPGRRQPRVVVEHPAEVLAVGEDLVLQRQEHAGRVDQVDQRQPVLQGDLLGPEDLLAGDREPRPGLDGRVVGDDDAAPARHRPDGGDDPRGRRAAPLRVHPPAGPHPELETRRAGVEQRRDALAGEHLALAAKALRGLRAAAQMQRRDLAVEPVDHGSPVVEVRLERLVPLHRPGKRPHAPSRCRDRKPTRFRRPGKGPSQGACQIRK